MMFMVKNRTYKDPLAAAMDWYLRVSGTTADALGKTIGYKNGKMVGHIRSELSSGSEFKRRAIAEYFGYTYDEFLKVGQSIIDGTFNGSPMPKANAPPEPKCPTCEQQLFDLQKKQDQNFWGIMNEFSDRKTALKINRFLIEIEKMAGPLGLGRAMGNIEALKNECQRGEGEAPALGTGTRGGF